MGNADIQYPVNVRYTYKCTYIHIRLSTLTIECVYYDLYVLVAPMVNMNASVEYETLRITDDGTSSMSCTTTPGNVVILCICFNTYIQV